VSARLPIDPEGARVFEVLRSIPALGVEAGDRLVYRPDRPEANLIRALDERTSRTLVVMPSDIRELYVPASVPARFPSPRDTLNRGGAR
jgi:hypothetical protein